MNNNYNPQQNPQQGFNNYQQTPTPPPQPVDEDIYTMGAKAYYETAITNLRTNKTHLKIDESVLKDIDKISVRIANKYGYESNEFRKFAEKVRSYETLQDDVGKLIRATKRRQILARCIAFLCVIAVATGIYLLLNTNTYYRDPSDFYYIYRRNIFGNKEKVIKVQADSLAKYKGKLYFIGKNDKHLYYANIKDLKVDPTSDVEESTPENTTEIECIYDEQPCKFVEVSDGKLMITTEEDEELYFNTKTGEVED